MMINEMDKTLYEVSQKMMQYLEFVRKYLKTFVFQVPFRQKVGALSMLSYLK